MIYYLLNFTFYRSDTKEKPRVEFHYSALAWKCLENPTKNGERSILTLGSSAYIAVYGIQRDADLIFLLYIFSWKRDGKRNVFYSTFTKNAKFYFFYESLSL